jgi:hypothetical protein
MTKSLSSGWNIKKKLYLKMPKIKPQTPKSTKCFWARQVPHFSFSWWPLHWQILNTRPSWKLPDHRGSTLKNIPLILRTACLDIDCVFHLVTKMVDRAGFLETGNGDVCIIHTIKCYLFSIWLINWLISCSDEGSGKRSRFSTKTYMTTMLVI